MTDNATDDLSDIPDLCRECEARHKGVCGALKPHELKQLNDISTKKDFDSGTVLIGDEQDFPFFANVLSGVLKLAKILPDGRQQIVGLQYAPDFMGRPFHSESHLSVEAASNVRLCAIPRSGFEKMLNQSPELQQRLLKQTLIELDESRDWLVTLGRKSARERVASFLTMIAQHVPIRQEASEQGRIAFDLPLSRADMADFLGLTIETVSRQLTRLKKDGLIAISHNRHIDVPDIEALRSAGEQ